MNVNDELKSIYNKHYNRYIKELKSYAKESFEHIILPYLKVHHLNFHARQGSDGISVTDKTPEWFVRIYKKKGQTLVLDRDKLPESLLYVLDAEIPDMDDEFLCIYMPDYKD